MIETLQVFVLPKDGKKKEFSAWLGAIEKKGYRLDRERWKSLHGAVDVFTSPDNPKVLHVFEQAKRDGIVERWDRALIQQQYSPQEVAGAEVFSFAHVGRDINIPIGKDKVIGVSHVAEFDTEEACKVCGAGARQVGTLRVLGSELGKSGRFASIGILSNEFVMVSESLVGQLSEACEERMPLRPVQATGKGAAGGKWWQLDPTFEVPIEACREMRYTRVVCKGCHVVRLTCPPPKQEPFGGYMTVVESRIKRLRLPPVMLSPYWDGDIERYNDGRLITTPARRMWFRGDIARALAGMRIHGLELTPILGS